MIYTNNLIAIQKLSYTNGISAGFITYTCTNHPEIILQDPGKCPECGKDLVKKY